MPGDHNGGDDRLHRSHLAEAIQAVKDYIRKKQSEPLYEDGDKQDALYRQLCTTQVTASSD